MGVNLKPAFISDHNCFHKVWILAKMLRESKVHRSALTLFVVSIEVTIHAELSLTLVCLEFYPSMSILTLFLLQQVDNHLETCVHLSISYLLHQHLSRCVGVHLNHDT